MTISLLVSELWVLKQSGFVNWVAIDLNSYLSNLILVGGLGSNLEGGSSNFGGRLRTYCGHLCKFFQTGLRLGTPRLGRLVSLLS